MKPIPLRLLFFAIALGATALLAESAGVVADDAAFLEQVELRSVVTLAGETRVSLHDPANQRTFWVAVGGERDGLRVVAHDADTNRVILRYGEAEREVRLRASRVREVEEPPAPSLSPEERRAEFRALRDEWREIHGRWREAARDSEELRELEQQFRLLGEEIRNVVIGIALAEEGSDEYRRLERRRRELGNEFRSLFETSLETVEQHPGFDPGDADSLRRMQRMLPSEWR